MTIDKDAVERVGTSACPICGKAEPHWHDPSERNPVLNKAAHIIASYETGAAAHSPFCDRHIKEHPAILETAGKVLALTLPARLELRGYAQPCDRHEYIEMDCSDCGKVVPTEQTDDVVVILSSVCGRHFDDGCQSCASAKESNDRRLAKSSMTERSQEQDDGH